MRRILVHRHVRHRQVERFDSVDATLPLADVVDRLIEIGTAS